MCLEYKMANSVQEFEKTVTNYLNHKFPNDADGDNIEKIKHLQNALNNKAPEIENNPNLKQAVNNIFASLKNNTIDKFIDYLNKEYTNDLTNEKKINRINELSKNVENIPDPIDKSITKELYNSTIDKLKKNGVSVPTITPPVDPVPTIVPKSMSVEEYETQITTILNQTFPNPNDNYRKISYIQDNSIEMIERAGMNDVESKKRYNIALNNISKKLESHIVDSNIEYLNKKYQNDPTNIEKIKDLMDIKESFVNSNIEGFDTSTIMDETKYKTVAKLLSSSNDLSTQTHEYKTTIDTALEFHKTLDSSLNNLFSYLKTQNVNPDVLYEKVNYRDIEHQKLFNMNKALDILFYSFYFSFLLIMICMGNVKREHFLIYLFVGLIPVVYPFIFKFGKLLVDYLSPPLHGPKNAFVDIHNTIYAYNI